MDQKRRAGQCSAVVFAVASMVGCSGNDAGERLIPAEEFSRSVHAGTGSDFSIFRIKSPSERGADPIDAAAQPIPAAAHGAGSDARAALGASNEPPQAAGDPRYLSKGLALKRSYSDAPVSRQPMFVADGDVAGEVAARQIFAEGAPTMDPTRQPPRLPQLPPGSHSPYPFGQMTANPSLWPDEAQGATLFTDFRAFQAMDVITVLVNESNQGKKTTKANSEGKFSLLAGIASFFGFESSWASNNEGLDPESLVSATTESKFEGKGEMKREGALKARLSAVIMEVLPNGLLRIEGTKIVAVDSEEEVMVISGLVRTRDIDSMNQVESTRVANMRIDFYGRGVLGDQQSPGWGSRVFEKIWPF